VHQREAGSTNTVTLGDLGVKKLRLSPWQITLHTKGGREGNDTWGSGTCAMQTNQINLYNRIRSQEGQLRDYKIGSLLDSSLTRQKITSITICWIIHKKAVS
jgi:hypothetical protein